MKLPISTSPDNTEQLGLGVFDSNLRQIRDIELKSVRKLFKVMHPASDGRLHPTQKHLNGDIPTSDSACNACACGHGLNKCTDRGDFSSAVRCLELN